MAKLTMFYVMHNGEFIYIKEGQAYRVRSHMDATYYKDEAQAQEAIDTLDDKEGYVIIDGTK